MQQHPISPHLQVYRLPLTALLSITHRFTAVVLSVGVPLLIIILVIAATDRAAYETVHQMLAAWWGRALLVLWTLALYFHFCHGIRHLLWDISIGFSEGAGRIANVLTLAGTLILTALTWYIASTA